MKEMRIGNGFDVHKLEAGEKIVLCGINIKHNKCLIGHSDADVGLHSLTDAIFGALGKGDLGHWFPPNDDKWKDANSTIFLQQALNFMKQEKYMISNMDLTFICERPKISEHSKKMQSNLARLCNIKSQRINIKATTSEGLGFTGRDEGIAVMTSILLTKE